MEEKPRFLQKVQDIAKNATTRSGEMVEAAKINGEISRLQADIEDIQFELGKAYYEAHRGDLNCAFGTYIHRIAQCEREIHEREIRLLARKGLMHCPYCDIVVAMDDEFCSKCGNRMPGPAQQAQTISCRNCGATVDAKLTFCFQCGYKLQ